MDKYTVHLGLSAWSTYCGTDAAETETSNFLADITCPDCLEYYSKLSLESDYQGWLPEDFVDPMHSEPTDYQMKSPVCPVCGITGSAIGETTCWSCGAQII